MTIASRNNQSATQAALLFTQQINRPKRRSAALLLGLLITVAGCGTLGGRDPALHIQQRPSYYYPGVNYDWQMLTLQGPGYIPMFCYLSIGCPFIILLSMPVDFAIDTVMLYSDHQNKLEWDRDFNRYLRKEYCFNEGGPDTAELEKLGLDASFCRANGNHK